MEVIHKPINNFEKCYTISNTGIVTSLPRKTSFVSKGNIQTRNIPTKILSPGNNGNGYLFVYLWINNISKRYYIHILVATHFIPLVKGKHIVNHKDGNKNNNCDSNLEWTTNSENMYHSYKTNLSPSGEKHGNAKLSNIDRIKMLEEYANNSLSLKNTVKSYNVCETILARMVRNYIRKNKDELSKKLRIKRSNNFK